MSKKKYFGQMTVALAAVPLLLVSCVNPDYDLTQDIDKNISINGDISAPFGDSELLSVTDFLSLDESDGSVLKTDENGDYYIHVNGGNASTKFSVPLFKFNEEFLTDGGFRMDLRKSSLPLPSSGPIPSGVYKKTFNPAKSPITVDEAVPEEIIDIQDVIASGDVVLDLYTTAGKLTLDGVVLHFPKYLKLEIADNAYVESYDAAANALKLKKMTVTTTPVVIRLHVTEVDFTKIPAGQGFQADKHRIIINDNVVLDSFECSVQLTDLGNDVADVPQVITTHIDISIASVTVTGAMVKVKPKVSLDPVYENVGRLPEFLTKDDAVLDMMKPRVLLDIDNTSPLTLYLSGELITERGSLATRVRVGDDKTVKAAPGAQSKLCLHAKNDNAPAGYTSVLVEKLPELFMTTPERVGADAMKADTEDEFVFIKSGDKYDFICSYEVSVPLVFGKKVKLTCTDVLDGWNKTFNSDNDSFSLDVNNAEVKMDLVNSIPLTLKLSAEAIDVNGAVIPEIPVNVEGSIAPGSIDKPSAQPVKLTFSASAENMRKLDGMKLILEVSNPGEMEGVCLNKNQGVQFRNMKLRLLGRMDMEL